MKICKIVFLKNALKEEKEREKMISIMFEKQGSFHDL